MVPSEAVEVNLATLSLGDAAGNDDYFNPNLENKLQMYTAARKEAFLAIDNMLEHHINGELMEKGQVVTVSKKGVRAGHYTMVYRPEKWTVENIQRNDAPFLHQTLWLLNI